MHSVSYDVYDCCALVGQDCVPLLSDAPLLPAVALSYV
jgi:hypothetical protein